jgi:L-asparagine transporter-like permease
MITNRTPFKGVTGLVFVVAVLGILLVAVPATRWFLLLSLPAGALVGVILYLLRSRDR